jgi:hypothetical protein
MVSEALDRLVSIYAISIINSILIWASTKWIKAWIPGIFRSGYINHLSKYSYMVTSGSWCFSYCLDLCCRSTFSKLEERPASLAVLLGGIWGWCCPFWWFYHFITFGLKWIGLDKRHLIESKPKTSANSLLICFLELGSATTLGQRQPGL